MARFYYDISLKEAVLTTYNDAEMSPRKLVTRLGDIKRV